MRKCAEKVANRAAETTPRVHEKGKATVETGWMRRNMRISGENQT